MMSEQLVGCGVHASVTVHQPCVTGTTKGPSIQPSLPDHGRPGVSNGTLVTTCYMKIEPSIKLIGSTHLEAIL